MTHDAATPNTSAPSPTPSPAPSPAETTLSAAPSAASDRRALLAGIGGIAAGALLVSRASAGPLTPPTGTLASTGKTLTEVEPRIAISATNTPGDASNVVVISQPGSYYLTENLSVPSGKNGINIQTDHATIDLNGFAITGRPGSLTGITAPNFSGGQTHHIRNGAVKGLGGFGINLASTQGSILEGLTVEDCGNVGLQISGTQTRISRCAAFRNASHGYSISADGVLSDCVSGLNTGNGFICSVHAVLDRCTSSNDANGFALAFAVATSCSYTGSGIGFSTIGALTATGCRAVGGAIGFASTSTGLQAHLRNCVADSCGLGFQLIGTSGRVVIESCTASNSSGNGFSLADGATIIDSVARNNAGFGMSINSNGVFRRCTLLANSVQYAMNAANNCVIDACHFTSNTVGGVLCSSANTITNCTFTANGGAGAAVRMNGTGNAIDTCQFNNNATAISSTVGGNAITRNRLAGNTTKYSLIGTNFVGTSVTTAAGLATANAWANIEF